MDNVLTETLGQLTFAYLTVGAVMMVFGFGWLPLLVAGTSLVVLNSFFNTLGRVGRR